MSVRVMTWVWDHSRSKKSQRLVLLAIADCASDDGGNAYPSMAELVRKTGLSERGVQTNIRELEALRELRVHRNAGPGGCNRYRVIMTPAASAPPAGTAPPAASAGVVGGSAPSTPAASAPHPAASAPLPPQILRDPPAVPAPGTVLEPSLEPSVRTTPAASRPAEVIDAEIVDEPKNLPVPATPNAGSLTAAWIDHCSAHNVKLTKSIIGRYGKAIAEAQKQGFPESLIKRALAQMLTDGEASRPSLFDNYLVRAQSGPARGPRKLTPGERTATKFVNGANGEQVRAVIADILKPAEHAS